MNIDCTGFIYLYTFIDQFTYHIFTQFLLNKQQLVTFKHKQHLQYYRERQASYPSTSQKDHPYH